MVVAKFLISYSEYKENDIEDCDCYIKFKDEDHFSTISEKEIMYLLLDNFIKKIKLLSLIDDEIFDGNLLLDLS